VTRHFCGPRPNHVPLGRFRLDRGSGESYGRRLPRWIDGVYIRGGPAVGQPVTDLRSFWQLMERRDQG